MTNKEWENYILNNKVAISDTVNYVSSSASISCFDPDHGKIYTVYHASRTNYGESRDVLALAVIPVGQPHKTENYVVLKHGDEQNGIVYRDMIDSNIVFMGNFVRIFFISGGTQYFYIDFDIHKKTFSEIKPVLCTYDGVTRELKDTVFEEYLKSRGLTGYRFDDVYEHIINTSRIYRHGSYWYGCLTSFLCQPVIYRTKDCINYEFVGYIDKLAKYETQTAIVEDLMYTLLRGAKGDNFYVSNDLGKTFTPAGRIEFNETRPQLLEYKGKLLMAISLVDIEPNLVRNGRNNMKILLGNGQNLSEYEEVLFIKDKYGIVYYDIINYKNVLYMIWSNADLYLDKSNHAKDLLYYSKIGELELG
ncbi:MAG TPA: hypothetical protein GXX20_05885 [Clostridiaceae bacterium]|nr:hypothetical protein [Clostridiaceae bacterium]